MAQVGAVEAFFQIYPDLRFTGLPVSFALPMSYVSLPLHQPSVLPFALLVAPLIPYTEVLVHTQAPHNFSAQR